MRQQVPWTARVRGWCRGPWTTSWPAAPRLSSPTASPPSCQPTTLQVLSPSCKYQFEGAQIVSTLEHDHGRVDHYILKCFLHAINNIFSGSLMAPSKGISVLGGTDEAMFRVFVSNFLRQLSNVIILGKTWTFTAFLSAKSYDCQTPLIVKALQPDIFIAALNGYLM